MRNGEDKKIYNTFKHISFHINFTIILISLISFLTSSILFQRAIAQEKQKEIKNNKKEREKEKGIILEMGKDPFSIELEKMGKKKEDKTESAEKIGKTEKPKMEEIKLKGVIISVQKIATLEIGGEIYIMKENEENEHMKVLKISEDGVVVLDKKNKVKNELKF